MLITENDFIIGDHAGDMDQDALGHINQWGLSLSNSIWGFKVEANHFIESLGSSATSNTTVGIWANNTGTTENLINRNTFEDLDRGIHCTRINKFNGTFSTSPGLKLECNEYSNLGYDIFSTKPEWLLIPYGLSAYYGIKTYQGNTALPTGNSFSNNSDFQEADLYNSMPNFLRYYYFDGDSAQNPDSVSLNVALFQLSNENPCAPTYTSGSSWLVTDLELAGLIGTYEAYKDTFDLVFEMYRDSLDAGNTDSLITVINGASPSDSTTLYNSLMVHTPFLSETVLTALLDISTVISETMVMNLVDHNPGGSVNDRIFDLMIERDSVAYYPFVGSIKKNRGKSNNETKLNGQVNYYSERCSQIFNQIIGHIVCDTNGFELTEYTDEIDLYNAPQVQYMKANALIQTGLYSDAKNHVDYLEGNTEWLEITLNDVSNFSDYVYLIANAYKDGINIGQYNEDTSNIIALYELADTSDIYTGSCRARNVLNYFYEYGFWEEPEFAPEEPEKMLVIKPNLSQPLKKVLTVYPNPAETYINFRCEECSETDLQLKFFDLLGHLIFVTPFQSNYQMNIETWADGIYIYSLASEGVIIENGKFIVR